MTTKNARPNKRLVALTGVAMAAVLSPSGKIISSALAGAVLVGGIVVHKPELSPPSKQTATATSKTHKTYLAHAEPEPLNALFTSIEAEGHVMPVMLTAGSTASSSQSKPDLARGVPLTSMPLGRGLNSGTGVPRFGRQSAPSSQPQPSSPVTAIAPVPPTTTPATLCQGKQKLRGKCVTPPLCSGKQKLLGKCVVTQSEPASEVKPDEELANPLSLDPLEDTHSADLGDPPSNVPDDEGGAQTEPQGWPLNEPLLEQFANGGGHNPESGNPPAMMLGSGGPAAAGGAPVVPQGGLPDELLLTPFTDGGPASNEDPNSQQPSEKMVPQLFVASPLAISPTSVPEPSVIGLILLGMATMTWVGRRRSSTPGQQH